MLEPFLLFQLAAKNLKTNIKRHTLTSEQRGKKVGEISISVGKIKIIHHIFVIQNITLIEKNLNWTLRDSGSFRKEHLLKLLLVDVSKASLDSLNQNVNSYIFKNITRNYILLRERRTHLNWYFADQFNFTH